MYYYIFEPPRGPKDYERMAHIKKLSASLGIAGEMTQPLPGKNPDDLVRLAVEKRYSTIIAAGGVELINAVARACEPYDVVLGIIPTVEHPDIQHLIGTLDWKTAVQQLKKRRWKAVRLGLLNGQTAFLTPASLQIPPDISFTVETPTFQLQGTGGEIVLSPHAGQDGNEGVSLRIVSAERSATPSLLGRLFTRKATTVTDSSFTLPNLRIMTSREVPVTVAGQPVMATPVECVMQEKPLKLILASAGASTEGNKS
jgi:hypothetical protein